ncbi:hypothetical protein BaRGS_00001462 [Batillaria attramentaria]|uniref:Uncharacterized protein n=1 Tax=Batillaria attramentaria TaxID=370345 RepID=A0ABD0M772_9CAEN
MAHCNVAALKTLYPEGSRHHLIAATAVSRTVHLDPDCRSPPSISRDTVIGVTFASRKGLEEVTWKCLPTDTSDSRRAVCGCPFDKTPKSTANTITSGMYLFLTERDISEGPFRSRYTCDLLQLNLNDEQSGSQRTVHGRKGTD